MMLFNIKLKDMPLCLLIRLTYCHRAGHQPLSLIDYCKNCGAPWLLHIPVPKELP